MTQELSASPPAGSSPTGGSAERDKLMTTELVPEQILPKVMTTFGLTAAYVFIDTLGAGGMWADILVEQSNFLICPMMPSETDVKITRDTYQYYRRACEAADDPSLMPPTS